MFDYPVLGSGPDTFGKMLKEHTGLEIALYSKAHNEYLQIAITLGYPFLLVYLSLIGIVLLRLLKKAFKTGDILAISLFCCIIGYLIQALFNISVISTAPIYWGMLGIGAKVGKEEHCKTLEGF